MSAVLAWRTSLITSLLVLLTLWMLFGSWRSDVWADLLPFFQWLETTPMGVAGKTWGASFALVEAVHLMGLALMGGALLLGDGRLAGLWLTNVPCVEVQQQVRRLMNWALTILILTGIFMVSSVAVKVYYLEVYWYKMLTLLAGALFYYFIREPWARAALESEAPWQARLVALSNFLIWGTVAACGRWIGFSG